MHEVNLPTIEDVMGLPRWAIVAFAARCARRAVERSDEYRESAALRAAVSFAERAASEGKVLAESLGDEGTPEVVKNAAVACSEATTKFGLLAAHAARHAATIVLAAHVTPIDIAVREALGAMSCAADMRIPRAKIRSDFGHLFERAMSEDWRDDTPVAPKFFPTL